MRRLVVLLAILLFVPIAAHAQDVNVIDTVVEKFRTAAAAWQGGLQTIARNTFMELAAIQLVWALARLAFRRADFSEFVAELVNQIMYLGLFLWLLTTTTTWGPAIINSFRQAAGAASGTTVLAPGDVFKVGIDLAGQIIAQTSVWSPGASAGLIVCGLVVMGCFAWIVACMVLALIQSYFVISAGVLFMAFGGSAWTKDIAVAVVRATFGIGAKLFILQLLTSIGATFIQQWALQFTDVTAEGVVIEIGQALVLAVITKTIPDSFERMVGGVGFTGGGALVGAAAELTAATVAVGYAATRLATSIAGAGAVMGAAAQLASTQVAADEGGPTSRAARAAAFAGRTIMNAASGIETDIGGRLSGQGSRTGYAPFRAAADLNERSRLLQEDGTRPKPPTPPSAP